MNMHAQNELTEGLTLLGQSGAPAQNKLETFPAPAGVNVVTFTAPEFTSICPVTAQPDTGTITVQYGPTDKCLESKSFKLYLQTFRNEGIFWEALAVRVAQDLGRVLHPRWINVRAHQNPRGGITLEAEANFDRESSANWTFGLPEARGD
jgi:7-cyano-7-deazaguanine reductase